MKKETKLTFSIPEEDAKYVESIRVYNVKIPLSYIMEKILPLIKKGKICLNCGGEKEGKLSDWCGECYEKVKM